MKHGLFAAILAVSVLFNVGCSSNDTSDVVEKQSLGLTLRIGPTAEEVAKALAANKTFVVKVANELALHHADELRGPQGIQGPIGLEGPQGEPGISIPYTPSCPADTTEVAVNGHLVYCYELLPTVMTWPSCFLACPQQTGMKTASLRGMMLACSANSNALPPDSAPEHGQFWIEDADYYTFSLIPELTNQQTHENCGFCEVVNSQNFDATVSNPSCQRQETNGVDTWSEKLDPWSFKRWNFPNNKYELPCMCGSEPR